MSNFGDWDLTKGFNIQEEKAVLVSFTERHFFQIVNI